MNPKKEARRLFNKYDIAGRYFNLELKDAKNAYLMAKKCAIIACKEIIKTLPKRDMYDLSVIQSWEEVIKEIKNI